MNVPALVTGPTGAEAFVTLIGPLVAACGQTICSWIAVSFRTAACTPFASTAEPGVNPDPVIVTVVPYGPLVGVSDESASTVNGFVVVAFPPGVTTETTPVTAVAGIAV